MEDSPSYLMGRSTSMTSMIWNLTRVTVRERTGVEASENILEKELTNLWYDLVMDNPDT